MKLPVLDRSVDLAAVQGLLSVADEGPQLPEHLPRGRRSEARDLDCRAAPANPA
jgi:hypothetical protein